MKGIESQLPGPPPVKVHLRLRNFHRFWLPGVVSVGPVRYNGTMNNTAAYYYSKFIDLMVTNSVSADEYMELWHHFDGDIGKVIAEIERNSFAGYYQPPLFI